MHRRGLAASSRKNNEFRACCVKFHDKQSVPSLLHLRTEKPQSRQRQKVLYLSLQQASQSKVAVKPPEREDAKDAPLNLYKPKEPYTATIVSVDGIVGPKSPGEHAIL